MTRNSSPTRLAIHTRRPQRFIHVSSDFKNRQMRQALDAAEKAALRRACAQAEAEAEMDDVFDDPTPTGRAVNRRKAR